MGNDHMGIPPVDRQTHTCENITFLQLRWRVVNIRYWPFLQFYVSDSVNAVLHCRSGLLHCKQWCVPPAGSLERRTPCIFRVFHWWGSRIRMWAVFCRWMFLQGESHSTEGGSQRRVLQEPCSYSPSTNDRWKDVIQSTSCLAPNLFTKTKQSDFFSKWSDFRPIRWIRQNGQNHLCLNMIQLQPYTNTENILV